MEGKQDLEWEDFSLFITLLLQNTDSNPAMHWQRDPLGKLFEP